MTSEPSLPSSSSPVGRASTMGLRPKPRSFALGYLRQIEIRLGSGGSSPPDPLPYGSRLTLGSHSCRALSFSRQDYRHSDHRPRSSRYGEPRFRFAGGIHAKYSGGAGGQSPCRVFQLAFDLWKAKPRVGRQSYETDTPSSCPSAISIASDIIIPMDVPLSA